MRFFYIYFNYLVLVKTNIHISILVFFASSFSSFNAQSTDLILVILKPKSINIVKDLRFVIIVLRKDARTLNKAFVAI
jgi:hypothetical protein